MAGLLAMLVLGLGGCADENSPAATGDQPDAASSVLPSALPAPERAPLAADRSPAGAQAFVRYWFQTLDYATQTGDISRLTAASDPSCKPCEGAIAVVRESYSDGGYLQGGTYKVRAVAAEEFAPVERPMIRVSFDRSSRSGYGPDGQVRGSLPAATFVSCQLTVAWVSNGWKVTTIVGDLMPA